MYLYQDEDGKLKLLRTKIVATIGRPPDKGKKLFNPEDHPIEFGDAKSFYEEVLEWFRQPGRPDLYMIDIIRLNLAFAKEEEEEHGEYGRNESLVFEWLKQHKGDRAKNVAVLGDLPGPKLRLGDVDNTVHLGEEEIFQLYCGKRKSPGEQGASILAYDKALGKMVNYNKLRSLIKGKMIIIGDGEPILKVVDESDGILKCEVEKGGEISNRKGVTIRGLELEITTFKDEDKRAVDFLLEHGYDWEDKDFTDPQSLGSFLGFIGVSFVKEKQDILKVKQYIEKKLLEESRNTKAKAWQMARQRIQKALEEQGRDPKPDELDELVARLLSPAIIAKIETPQAWKKIDEILDIADGAMVARGDLGLQLDPQEVPEIQKQLIRLCNLRGKIVITATQMLNSMEENREPTRAEATDVFNAILDGSDAVMLSGETSKGRYPFHAVLMMAKIAEKAERHLKNFGRREPLDDEREIRRLNEQRYEELLVGVDEIVDENTRRLWSGHRKASLAKDPWAEKLYKQKAHKSEKQDTTDRISLSACRLAESDGCRAIITPTATGRTARMIARFRPSVPIIGVAHDIINRRKLLISFGVYPINVGMLFEGQHVFEDVEEMFKQACEEIKNYEYIEDIIIGKRKDGIEAVFTAGTPLFEPGTTNLVQIREVPR